MQLLSRVGNLCEGVYRLVLYMIGCVGLLAAWTQTRRPESIELRDMDRVFR